MLKIKSLEGRTGTISGHEGMKVKFVNGISEEVDELTAEHFAKIPGYMILKEEGKENFIVDEELFIEEEKEEREKREAMERKEERERKEGKKEKQHFDPIVFKSLHYRTQVKKIKDDEVPIEYLTYINKKNLFSGSVIKAAEKKLKEV